MKKSFGKVSLAAYIITGLVALNAAGCGNSGGEEKKQQAPKTSKIDSIAVETVSVESRKMEITKVYNGSLEGEQQATIVSQLAERIVGIPVKVGSSVRAGQVVVNLDKGGVTSQYYQAQSNLKNIEKNLNRMKSLFESGAVSRQQLDEVQTGYDVAKANFNAARSAVEITSPISGIVTEIKPNIGEFTSPGVPIMIIARTSTLKMIMSVGEADIPYVKMGQPVKIYSELNSAVAANGRISEIAGSADQQTRTFQVKASFGNTGGQWFKPGMFAKAEIKLSSAKPQNIIPREAVIYSDEGPKVFIISGGKAYSRKVKLGMQNETEVEVTEGLQKGESVVRAGANSLKEGSFVIVRNDALAAK